MATGLFDNLGQYKDGMKLYKGDILVTCTKGHTVIVTSSDYSRDVSAPKPPTPAVSNEYYNVGTNYTLQVELKVRTGAGTNYRAKKHSELTSGGRAHDTDGDGALNKGTGVTCQQITKIGNDVWIKCPSGWLAAYYQGHSYVS